MHTKFDFAGASVIVTGGARGIGLELGRAFASWGASVHLLDVDDAELAVAAAEAGCVGIPADVSRTDDVQTAVDRVLAATGRIDVLINNAGITRDNVVWKISDSDWETVLATHAGGTFRCTRAVVPQMRAQGGGRIINVTSYTGLRGNPGQANYAMAKAGIVGFTKTTAKELARFGITVNAISPSADTRMTLELPKEARDALTSAIPMGRFAHASEIAPAAGFLASREAAYVTGVVLPIDGGVAI